MTLNIIILAAGKGTRMYSRQPKVLHPIGGKPMLAHVIQTAQTLAPQAIHVVIGHGKEQVKQQLAAANRAAWHRTRRQNRAAASAAAWAHAGAIRRCAAD